MQHSTMRITAVLLLAVAALLHSAESHSVGIGQCDPVLSQDNFQPDQFTGLWYVIEIFSTTSKCMTMTFNRTESGFKVTEGREFYLGRMVNLDHTFKNTGTFTITDSSNPGKMRANWPSNFISDADVVVVDTDYTKYAVLFECQSLFVINRHSAAILSRERTLDAETVQKIKDDMAVFGVDVGDFDIMDHRTCNLPGEADFNWEIDENTFNQGEFGEVSPPGVDLTDVEAIEADPNLNEVF